MCGCSQSIWGQVSRTVVSSHTLSLSLVWCYNIYYHHYRFRTDLPCIVWRKRFWRVPSGVVLSYSSCVVATYEHGDPDKIIVYISYTFFLCCQSLNRYSICKFFWKFYYIQERKQPINSDLIPNHFLSITFF